MELASYSGREQQRKGTVIANVQKFVFGETLPRGHGHRGRLSAYVDVNEIEFNIDVWII